MTNLSQETLLKHIEEELPRSERNYKENQLWKEGGVADALQTAMRRKKLIAFLLISLCLFVFALAVFQAAISPSHPSPSYLVSMGTTILSFFFTQRLVCSNSRLELLSELWNELEEANEAAERKDESSKLKTQSEMIGT